MTVQILTPRIGDVARAGSLHVAGVATGKGLPEPTVVERVTVQVDGGAAVTATLKRLPSHPGSPPAWTFSASVAVTGGAHTLHVKAINDAGTSAGNASVTITVAPFTFSTTATFKTGASEAKGPFDFNLLMGATFTNNHHDVTLLGFPTLTTSDVTVTLTAGGSGTFNPTTGSMSIPVTLKFHPSSSLASDSTLSLQLSTGAETSPHGLFSDHGHPMDASGAIVLVGDGVFQGGFPLGNNDASLVLVGSFTPHP